MPVGESQIFSTEGLDSPANQWRPSPGDHAAGQNLCRRREKADINGRAAVDGEPQMDRQPPEGGWMLKAQRRKQFIDVYRGDRLVTSFDYVKRLPFSFDGQEYTAKATSLLGVSFSLYRGDEETVVEKTTSLLTNAQQIEHGGTTWLMKPANYFGKKFNVMSEGGENLGIIAPARYFFPLSDITIDLPDDVPVLAQLFMLWLAVRSWTMDTGSST